MNNNNFYTCIITQDSIDYLIFFKYTALKYSTVTFTLQMQ